LMGRTLLRKLKNKEKFVAVVNLMENPKTGELMSKSRGTGVFLNTTPFEMYGAIMAQPDEMIKVLFVNCTKLSLVEIENVLITQNPLNAKKYVAKEIVKIIHGEKEAEEAEDKFIKTFQKSEIPDDILEVEVNNNELLVDVLLKNKFVASKTDFRRLVGEGAITKLETKEKIKENNIHVSDGTYRIGKKRFLKINVKK